MKTVSYNILKSRQKSYIKAYAVLCRVIGILMGFYSYQKWEQYSSAVALVEANENLIGALKDASAEESADYDDKRDTFEDLQSQINNSLTKILPVTDNYQRLTRQLDAFEDEIATKNNPFEISNISFQEVEEVDNFAILPVRMTIESSNDNFTKFLHYIESSGSLNTEIRLMDISSIRLNFKDDGDVDIITFTVQINAYFRK